MDVRDKTDFSSHLFIHLLIIIRIVYALHEGLHFQLVSSTNQLIIFLLQFSLQILPVITVLGIIVLLIQYADNIQHGEPPFVVFPRPKPLLPPGLYKIWLIIFCPYNYTFWHIEPVQRYTFRHIIPKFRCLFFDTLRQFNLKIRNLYKH